jgi:phospholipid/cholesterol/gamma-HCH transport system permease protein
MNAPASASAVRYCGLDDAGDRSALRLYGAWRLSALPQIAADLQALPLAGTVAVDGSTLEELDSAAALGLLCALDAAGLDLEHVAWRGFSEVHARILHDTAQRQSHHLLPLARPPRAALAAFGREIFSLGQLLRGHLNFFGVTCAALASVIVRPRLLRLRELTVQIQHCLLEAMPVVALVTLLIGVTIAYLLGLQAEKYGANIFVVDGVGIGMTREFAPIIVAVIVAGRSGAAFTAQLGAMRLTEEIDAIRTLGLSPAQVLVVPRVLALVLALPLLVFIGDAVGILGAMLVAGPMLGITPVAFLDRLRSSLDLVHVWVGLGKAPVFALVIALIGCKMGMTVGRDTRAVGLATTSTVVQSIVSVILLDAAFAVLFQQLGL